MHRLFNHYDAQAVNFLSSESLSLTLGFIGIADAIEISTKAHNKTANTANLRMAGNSFS